MFRVLCAWWKHSCTVCFRSVQRLMAILKLGFQSDLPGQDQIFEFSHDLLFSIGSRMLHVVLIYVKNSHDSNLTVLSHESWWPWELKKGLTQKEYRQSEISWDSSLRVEQMLWLKMLHSIGTLIQIRFVFINSCSFRHELNCSKSLCFQTSCRHFSVDIHSWRESFSPFPNL